MAWEKGGGQLSKDGGGAEPASGGTVPSPPADPSPQHPGELLETCL